MSTPIDARQGSRTKLTSPLASSMLVKVLGAMVIALVLSSAITGVVAARFARSALSRQARQLAASHLRILQEVFGQRDRDLLVNLRSVAEAINVGALTDPERHNELVGQLGRASTNYQLDLLEVVDGRSWSTRPMAAVGDVARGSDTGGGGRYAIGSTSQLLAIEQGGYVQAVQVAIGGTPFHVIGGFHFDDGFAFDLRRQLGDLDDVVLVASDRVVGSTLAQPVSIPPAMVGGQLPSSPASAEVGRARRLVAYVPIGVSTGAFRSGALGVVQADPVGPLTKSLDRQRLVTAAALALVAAGLAWLLFRYLMRPLVELSRTAGLIAAGDTTASFSARGADEVGMLASSLEEMRVELATRLGLIERQAAELQQSSRRTVTAQDEERRRIARDLHDGLQQHLVVLRMRLGMLAEADGAAAERPLDELGRDLDRVIEQLREVSHDLYPSILVDRGLTAGLHSYVGRLPVSTKLILDPDPLPRLPLPVESGAYFTLCEALTNALKHSGASEVVISISLVGDRLRLSVSDNGRGFSHSAASGGLLHMEDRVRSFGGDLRIVTRPGDGTRIFASFLVEQPPLGAQPKHQQP